MNTIYLNQQNPNNPVWFYIIKDNGIDCRKYYLFRYELTCALCGDEVLCADILPNDGKQCLTEHLTACPGKKSTVVKLAKRMRKLFPRKGAFR